MVRRRGPRLTAAQKAEVWRRWRQGQSLTDIARALGRIPKMVHYVVGGFSSLVGGQDRLGGLDSRRSRTCAFGCATCCAWEAGFATSCDYRIGHRVSGVRLQRRAWDDLNAAAPLADCPSS